MLHQSTRYRVTVNIAQLLHALLLAPDVEIVVARLPERMRLNIPALRFAIGRATLALLSSFKIPRGRRTWNPALCTKRKEHAIFGVPEVGATALTDQTSPLSPCGRSG